MHGNGLAFVQPRMKIFALQHASHPIVRTQADNIFGGHFAEPFAVVADFRFFLVEDFVDLRKIGFGIGVNLLARQRRAGFRYARGVANHRRNIANQKNGGVAKVLKMLELAQNHGVAQVKIWGRGIHAQIGAQRLAGFQGVFEFGFEFGFGNDFSDAFFHVGELFFDGFDFYWRHNLNSVCPKHAAAFNLVVSFQDNFNGFGINAMLFFKNFFGEGGFRVSVENRHSGLQNNRTRVEIFVHEMDGAAGEFYAIFEGLALRFKPRERRKQRRMNIQDAIWIFCDKKRRQQAHVTGQADEVDVVLVENGGDLAVVDFALKAFRRDHARFDAAAFGALDARSAFTIADDDGDFRAGDASRCDAIREGLELRAAAALEHAYALVHKRKTLAQAAESTKRGRK